MPPIDDFHEPTHDEPPSEPTLPMPSTNLDDDPRSTLARILEQLLHAFGTDAGPDVERVLTTLALALTRHVHEPYALRAVIIAPAGSGKTRLLRLIASIVRLPAVIIPVVDLAETGWRGAQIGDACRLLHPSLFVRDEFSRRITVPTTTVALPSVVLLDEIDKISLRHGGIALEGSAAAARLGKQQFLLPVLDPESDLLVQYDDAAAPFRWSLRNSIVLCAGAFAMAPSDRALTPADLIDVGLSSELVDRLGPVWMLPMPGASTRASIARIKLRDVEAFAQRLGVTVTGIEAYAATLPAPGDTPDFIGLRGLLHAVTQRVLEAVADALTQKRTHVDLMDARGDV